MSITTSPLAISSSQSQSDSANSSKATARVQQRIELFFHAATTSAENKAFDNSAVANPEAQKTNFPALSTARNKYSQSAEYHTVHGKIKAICSKFFGGIMRIFKANKLDYTGENYKANAQSILKEYAQMRKSSDPAKPLSSMIVDISGAATAKSILLQLAVLDEVVKQGDCSLSAIEQHLKTYQGDKDNGVKGYKQYNEDELKSIQDIRKIDKHDSEPLRQLEQAYIKVQTAIENKIKKLEELKECAEIIKSIQETAAKQGYYLLNNSNDKSGQKRHNFKQQMLECYARC